MMEENFIFLIINNWDKDTFCIIDNLVKESINEKVW